MRQLSKNQAVIQLQSDPSPPAEVLERRRREQAGGAVEIQETGQEIVDVGAGVATIEAGGPLIVPQEQEREEEEPPENLSLQAKSTNQSPYQPALPTPGAILQDLDSGAPMNKQLRNGMENRFGATGFGGSFHDVKFHTGPRANTLTKSLGAHAFTIGNHVAFAAGKYQPDTNDGRKLIAHELTHVIQQQQGVTSDLQSAGMGHPGDKHEREADRVAAHVVRQTNDVGGNSPGKPLPVASLGQRSGGYNRDVIQLYSNSAAASYARTWATSANTAYGRFSNDCTNFVSQAMEAGGWSMIVGSSYCDDRKKDSVWWFNRGGCRYTACPWSWCPTVKTVDASHTWGGAHNFYNFVRTSGRGTAAGRVWDLSVGDVLQMDFSGSGHIGHTMIVTKKTISNIYFSYHTSDHLDEPFWPEGKKTGILGRNPDPPTKYHAWKM
ncbi:MAG: DUF4157 domain-containing protein [Chloroflexi bacterium]|nr:DUF4157 domain-containing protein [Chloroflexota bacterium]